MRILLVVQRFNAKYGEYYDFPIGIGYISAALKRAGYDVHCLNLNNYPESIENVITKEVLRLKPNILGIGGLSVHYKKIKAVIDLVRLVLPSIIVMVGGGIISSEPELMLRALGANVGVIGEGDHTVVKLMDCINLGKEMTSVNGIIFRTIESGGRKIIATPNAQPISDIDSLPWVDYEGLGIREHLSFQRYTDRLWFNNINHNRNVRAIEMIGSRSCPFDCSFCFHPLGRVYRERSLNNFFIELENLISIYDVNSLMLLDELFAAKKERLIEFCNRIKTYNLRWAVQLRVDSVNEDILDLMKESGCISISYGIESMSEDVLRGMKKNTKPSMIEQALDVTYKKGIDIQGNLIFGDSSETISTAKETINWWKTHRKYKLSLNSIQQYPGTKIYKDAIEKNVLIDRLSFIEHECPVVNTTLINNDEFYGIINWIQLLNGVMSLPAKLIDVQKLDYIDPIRGELYDIECVCPHCASHNSFLSVCLSDYLSGSKLFRLTCSKCNHRFDIPKLIPELVFEEYIEILFDLSTKYLATDPAYSATLLNKIIQTDNRYSKAYYLLGEIFYMNKDFAKSYFYFAHAMINNPTVPFYFKSFGDLLCCLGRNDDAEMFFEQEKLLIFSNQHGI